MYYVYVLESAKDNGFYIGFSSDLKLRFKNHIDGQVDATKHRRPLILIYYESYSDKKLAQEREIKLKQFGLAYKELIKRIRKK